MLVETFLIDIITTMCQDSLNVPSGVMVTIKGGNTTMNRPVNDPQPLIWQFWNELIDRFEADRDLGGDEGIRAQTEHWYLHRQSNLMYLIEVVYLPTVKERPNVYTTLAGTRPLPFDELAKILQLDKVGDEQSFIDIIFDVSRYSVNNHAERWYQPTEEAPTPFDQLLRLLDWRDDRKVLAAE